MNLLTDLKRKKRAFISFDFDHDESLKNLLAGQAKLPDSPFEFHDWSVKEPFPQNVWISRVRTKIKSCDMVIVIISPNTHQCAGVLIEVAIANHEGIPCFGICQKGVRCITPRGLDKFYEWTWPNLKYLTMNSQKYVLSR